MKKLFPGLLETLMQKNGINQVQLHRRTGIAVSRVNNYVQGKYRTIKPSHLRLLCEAVSEDGSERGDLAKVYLLDMLPESVASILEIKPLATPKPQEDWYFDTNRLPPDFARRFEELYKLCVSSPKVRSRTAEWIEIMRESLPDQG